MGINAQDEWGSSDSRLLRSTTNPCKCVNVAPDDSSYIHRSRRACIPATSIYVTQLYTYTRPMKNHSVKSHGDKFQRSHTKTEHRLWSLRGNSHMNISPAHLRYKLGFLLLPSLLVVVAAETALFLCMKNAARRCRLSRASVHKTRSRSCMKRISVERCCAPRKRTPFRNDLSPHPLPPLLAHLHPLNANARTKKKTKKHATSGAGWRAAQKKYTWLTWDDRRWSSVVMRQRRVSFHFALETTVTHSGRACGEPAKLAARAGRVKSIFGRLWQLLKGLAQAQNWTVFSMKRGTKIPTAGFCWRERCFHFTDVCHRNVSP